jgi:hypothetical protein
MTDLLGMIKNPRERCVCVVLPRPYAAVARLELVDTSGELRVVVCDDARFGRPDGGILYE